MGIEIIWDTEEETILRYVFGEYWTWEDFFAAKDKAYNMIDAGGQKVGVIIDAPANVWLPHKLIVHGRRALQGKHKNTAIVVFVTSSPFVRTMVNAVITVSRGLNVYLSITSSVDDARVLIVKRLAAANKPVQS